MSSDENDLPQTPSQWDSEVQANKLAGISIHDYKGVLSSASTIKREQFLLLRVLWASESSDNDFRTPKDKSIFIGQKDYEKAQELLQAETFWSEYLKSFRNPLCAPSTRPFPKLGSMSQTRLYQLLCCTVPDTNQSASKFSPIMTRARTAALRARAAPETPTRAPKGRSVLSNEQDLEGLMGDMALEEDVSGLEATDLKTPNVNTPDQPKSAIVFQSPETSEILHPATEDEQIVNTALILFLTEITLYFDVRAKWSLHRKSFLFGKAGKKAYEARVDGYLQTFHDNQIKAIVEVKPFIREKKILEIQMQEAAQMAAWISSNPDANLTSEEPLR
jgi:hypothetical protein